MKDNGQTGSIVYGSIRTWVEKEFNPKYWNRVTEEIYSVASGETKGNNFVNAAISRIFPDWERGIK